MKTYILPLVLLCASLSLTSCGDDENNTINTPTEDVVPGTNHRILIAIFSEPQPDNGWEAASSASRLIVNGDLCGSVEYMATVDRRSNGRRQGTHPDGNALSGRIRSAGRPSQ